MGGLLLQQQDPSCVREFSPRPHGRTNRTFQKRAAPPPLLPGADALPSSAAPSPGPPSQSHGGQEVCAAHVTPTHIPVTGPRSRATSNPQGKAGTGHAFGDELAGRHRGLRRSLAPRVPLLGHAETWEQWHTTRALVHATPWHPREPCKNCHPRHDVSQGRGQAFDGTRATLGRRA